MITESSERPFQKIEPFLQDNLVGDADLVEVLVAENYSSLYLFAQILLFDPEEASRAVNKAVSTVVTQRRRYWGEVPLVVWINRLILEQCAKAGNGGLKIIRAGQLIQAGAHGENPSKDILHRLAYLTEQQRAALALRYGQKLTLEEIAQILVIPLTSAHVHLKAARRACLEGLGWRDYPNVKSSPGGVSHPAFLDLITDAADGLLEANQRPGLERHLGECRACRTSADELADQEAWLSDEIGALIRKADHRKEPRGMVLECLELVNRQNRLKWVSLLSQKYVFTSALVILLVGAVLRVILPLEDPVQPAALVAAPSLTPTPSPTLDPWEGYLRFSYNVSPEDTLDELAESLGLTVEAIAQVNRIRKDSQLHPGQELALAIDDTRFIPPPRAHQVVFPERLTAQADERTLLERMDRAGELLDTLWGDYRIIVYGPSGYSGPPFYNSRTQIWWLKEDYSVIIGGSVMSDASGLNVQYSTPSGFTFNEDTSTSRLHAYRNPGENIFYYIQNSTNWMGISGGEATLKIVGSDHILDRAALVVDWMPVEASYAARLWIDAESGLILRQRMFEDASMQTTLLDLGFSDLALNVDLPAQIFAPSNLTHAGFVSDYTGRPFPAGSRALIFPWSLPPDRQPKERVLPSPEIEPYEEALTLQWPMESVEGIEPMVDVFAGEYYMGSLHLPPGAFARVPADDYGSLPFGACMRSPDGRLVALSIYHTSSFSPRIYWFRLSDPEELGEVLSSMDTVNEFAFDPSSRYLAYYSCSGGECGIQVLDTNTKSVRMLVNTGRIGPSSITWSPDGKYLAFLGSNSSSYNRKIFVVRAANGAQIYEADYGWEARSVPADSPTHTWGMRFPAEEDSFMFFGQGCRYPYEYPQWNENDRRG